MEQSTELPVLVGIDGSSFTHAILDLAAHEAALRGVPLDIVAVEPEPEHWVTVGQRPHGPIGAGRVVAAAQERVQQQHGRLRAASRVVVGRPTSVLIDSSSSAVLTVLGHRGVGGFHGLATGSVCTQVATRAHGPVLVVRGAGAGTGAPVVIGVDVRAPVPAAIEFAFAEAALRGVPLEAVYVHPEPADEAARLLAEALAGGVERHPEVTVESMIESGHDPAGAILAASERAGIIVVGPHDQTAPRRLLLGSVAELLTHHSHCPVVVVHASASRVRDRRQRVAAGALS
jgi:nucleotide-binding universal stress UspA family protein